MFQNFLGAFSPDPYEEGTGLGASYQNPPHNLFPHYKTPGLAPASNSSY